MNDKIMTQICEKSMSGEINAEISMPDYEPEIRRLLRAGVTLTPPAGFSDSGRVGMSGEAIFDVLYAGNDGALYSTRTRESYELTEAFKPSEIGSDIISVVCEVTPESLISRASAPRKVSLRCKLRGRARGFGEQEISERDTYLENPDSIERLAGNSTYTHVFPSSFAEARLSEDFAAELPAGVSGDLRIIGHSAAAAVDRIEPSHDSAVVKGALELSILATVDDGDSAPFRLTRKIPFAEAVDAEGLTPECRCTAVAVCIDCDFSVDENRIFCEPTMLIRLDAEENRRTDYTTDIYSTEALSEHTSRRYEFPISKKVFSGNLTASLRETLEEAGISSDAVISDASASAVVKNVEENGEKLNIVGEVTLVILTNAQNEYSLKEIKMPFKYEVEGDEKGLFFANCEAVALIPRVKIDGGRILCDCELHISGRSYAKDEFSAVDEVIFGAPVEPSDATVVCFPSPTDTVWDISKRYHIPTRTLFSQESRLKNGEAVIF